MQEWALYWRQMPYKQRVLPRDLVLPYPHRPPLDTHFTHLRP